MNAKTKSLKSKLAALLLSLCLLMGLMPATVFAAQPTLTQGDVYRTTRTEAVVEFTSDTAGEYYYTAILPDDIPDVLEIDTTGTGTPCAAGETVPVTVGGLTTDSYLFFLVVKGEDGTESEVLFVEIPEWDWWVLDDAGVLTIESNKGLANWQNWLNAQDAFYQMWYKQSVTHVHLWKDVTCEIDGGDFPGNEYPSLTAYTVEDGNTAYTVSDGVLYRGDSLCAYPGGKADASFAIPDSVKYVSHGAFEGCKNLKTVTAGKIQTVGSYAFSGSSIESFSAESVGWIRYSAFSYCGSLTDFAVTGSEKIEMSEFSMFEGCTSLTSFPFELIAGDMAYNVFKNCSSLTEIIIPDSIKAIANDTFAGCSSVKEVTIPAQVTFVGSGAFASCSGLESVTFESAEPPICGSSTLQPLASNFRIHVPKGSENAYIEALGSDFAPYILDGGTSLYALFVNGQRFRSDNLTVACGDGTAVFDPGTSTLTLTNAQITQAGGDYGYRGAINSGLPELTIVLVGDNTILAGEADSINTARECDLTITGSGALTTNGQLDLGREPSFAFTGSEESGSLTVDGAKLDIGGYLWVQHDIRFTGGADVTVSRNITSNYSGAVSVDGNATAVSANALSLGNNVAGCRSKLAVSGGVLTLRSGTSAYEDPASYAVYFDPYSSGEIEITGGTFQTQSACAVTNIPEANITVGSAVDIKAGSWENGNLRISEHESVLVSERAATCTQDGTKSHYKCSSCNLLFEDADCTVLIQDPSVLVIPATGHTAGSEWLSTDTEHYRLCTVCQEEINKQAHIFAWVVDKPATEEEAGVKHEECSVCGKTRSENTEIPKLDHTHTGIVHHPAVAATCTETGNVEYWTCSSPLCQGKYYSDENCTTEIADVKTAVNFANHAGGTETRNASEATCITDGYTGDTYCKGCGAKLATGTVIPATGEHVGGEWQHNETEHWKNCATPGCGAVVDKGAHELAYRHNAVNHWQACTVCGATGDPAAHTFGDWSVTKEATESADGIKERACTVCGYAETAKIPATGIKPADPSTPVTDSTSQSGGATSQTPAGESAAATLPQTGDESSLLLWIVLLAVSGGALGIVTYKKRQSKLDS